MGPDFSEVQCLQRIDKPFHTFYFGAPSVGRATAAHIGPAPRWRPLKCHARPGRGPISSLPYAYAPGRRGTAEVCDEAVRALVRWFERSRGREFEARVMAWRAGQGADRDVN
eukprot:scaffold109_cov389-Prasinococcus_capsulatus_cf.AAC.5